MSTVQNAIEAVHTASAEVERSTNGGDFDEVIQARDNMQAAALQLANAVERLVEPPAFAPEGEPDELRDLWNENKSRVSSYMYFAIPGEQPIHVSDEEALHFLTYLSEQRR